MSYVNLPRAENRDAAKIEEKLFYKFTVDSVFTSVKNYKTL